MVTYRNLPAISTHKIREASYCLYLLTITCFLKSSIAGSFLLSKSTYTIRIEKYIGYSLVVTVLVMCISCHKSPAVSSPGPDNTATDTIPVTGSTTGVQDTLPVFPDDLPSTDNSIPALTITWEQQAAKISDGDGSYNASYPRARKMGGSRGSTLFMTYLTSSWGGFHGNVVLRESADDGMNWSEPRQIVKYDPDRDALYYGFKNPEFIFLQNGAIMLAYVGVGRSGMNDIWAVFSTDRGKMWTTPEIVYKGEGALWEPAMLQLPDGTIDLFFSSEEKWFQNTNLQQEIAMISSKDNGSTWSKPVTAAYSPGNRDGMAVPLLLKDGKGIIFPIESPGQKMPWIVWSSLSANFYYNSYATIENGRRWYVDPPPVAAPGGAPYIVQLSTGEILLNVQAAGGRNIKDQWKKSTQIILVGNSMGQNFTNASVAWPDLQSDEGTYFSSISLLDDSTILMSATRYLPDEHSEVWTKIGHIKR